MKKSPLLQLCFFLTMSLFELPLMAQGVMVYKKDGTQVKFSYEEIDSIVTYNVVENDEPVTPPMSSPAEAIDLGLPSGILWASCNVGATSPEEYGGYYAWGETEEKTNYSWSTYKWCNGDKDSMTKYCTDSQYGTVDNKTTLDPEDDVAHVKWGGSWRMPTKAEQDELRTECDWERISINGVDGFKVKSRVNENFIFLPAAGNRNGSDVSAQGEGGTYWSATIQAKDSNNSYYLYFLVDGYGWYRSGGRDGGLTVRPVTENLKEDKPERPLSSTKSYIVNGVSFEMVMIEGNTFTMGSPNENPDAWYSEKPAHQVTLDGYAIGMTEVTQELWLAVMGSNPSHFTGDLQHPVENISWNDCQSFINKLNTLTQEDFRLPTEAEWEYAAQGGNIGNGYKHSGSNDIDNVAWYCENSSSTTHPVKSKQANELGIYDMNGNVWEWCEDYFDYYSASAAMNPIGPVSGTLRVLRGGGWCDDVRYCRVKGRGSNDPQNRYNLNGLRLAMTYKQ